MDPLFAPPTGAWQRLAPAYATLLRIRMALGTVVVTAIAVGMGWYLLGWPWGIAAAVVGLGFLGWQWFRIGRWVRAWGYAERADDLYLSTGLWFRQLIVVPYGRMQAVKVESGPLERAFGLANVSLVTASLQSGATIPGLTHADAERLRDRLIAIGIGHEERR